jgi:HEAT repeat protein
LRSWRNIAGLGGCLLLGVAVASCSKPKSAEAPVAVVEEEVVEVEAVEPEGTADELQDVDQLLDAAQTATGTEQYTAIDDLGEEPQEAAKVVPVLEKLLASDDEHVRWRSARALGDYGDAATSAAPALLKLLTESNPVIQYHAAIALGRVGDKSDATIHALVNAVGSTDPRVTRAAIGALRNLQPEPSQVLAALEVALTSDDQAVVLQAMKAIADRGAAAVPLLNEALKNPKTALLACTIIEQIGPEAAETVPSLVNLLNDTKHSQLEIEALLALARIGAAAKPASPQIIELLETSTDNTVPVAAAFAVGAIGIEEGDEPLRKALTRDNEFLQMVASWSLVKLHPEDAALKQQAMDKLQAGLKSEDPAIQAAAAKGLKNLETGAAIPPKAAN